VGLKNDRWKGLHAREEHFTLLKLHTILREMSFAQGGQAAPGKKNHVEGGAGTGNTLFYNLLPATFPGAKKMKVKGEYRLDFQLRKKMATKEDVHGK